jgi:hypothetical protein
MAAALAGDNSTLGRMPRVRSEEQTGKSKLERKHDNDENKCVDCGVGDAGRDCDAAVVPGITERHSE